MLEAFVIALVSLFEIVPWYTSLCNVVCWFV